MSETTVAAWERQKPQPTPPPPPAIAGSLCWLPQGGLIHLDWSTHTQRWEAFMVTTVPLPKIASDNIAGAENAAGPALLAEFERKLAELRAYCDTQKSEVPYA